MPNALVDGVALDKLSRGHWVLISVDAVDAGDRDVLESHGCIVARTSDGRLCEWLRWGRSKAALVRPDRTVYLSDPDADAVVAAAAVDILVKGPL